MDFQTLIFVTEVWVIVGIVLILADMFLGMNYILLPIGIACLLIAAMVFGKNSGFLPTSMPLDDWKHVAYWFAGLSIASIAILKFFARSRSKKDEDVNLY